ncbi:MAG: four helix bundle protein [Planctomycetota bacterium]|nr:MAG: four helix bundle protein [Planctomycetota bacterium]
MGRIVGDLLDRTFNFAVSIMSLIDDLPNSHKGWEIGRQIIRSGTSIGANIREADNAITDADFTHKCSIARKEASEAYYWLKLCQHIGLLKGTKLEAAITESDELTRVLSSIVKKTQKHLDKEK